MLYIRGNDMLKIVNKAPCEDVLKESGEYVPFKFQLSRTDNRSHIYWRTGDFEKTLLEIEIDSKDGKITGGLLLLPGNVSKNFPILTGLDNTTNGTPVASITNWPDDRYIDEAGEIQIFSQSSDLLILISSKWQSTNCISTGGMIFGLSENGLLIWILAKGLSKDQLNQICC
jgi:hypothetical protein